MRQQLEFGKRKGGLQTYRLKSLPIGLGVYNPFCAGLNLHRIHFLTSSAFCPFRTYFLDIEFTSNYLNIKNIKETDLFYSILVQWKYHYVKLYSYHQLSTYYLGFYIHASQIGLQCKALWLWPCKRWARGRQVSCFYSHNGNIWVCCTRVYYDR